MTVFVCDQGHRFSHTAKHIEHTFNGLSDIDAQLAQFIHPADKVVVASTETPVCPICHSKVFSEAEEAQPESVYIHKLTTGPQTELDGLRAQGYKIVGRYSGAYHLEKPKETQQ